MGDGGRRATAGAAGATGACGGVPTPRRLRLAHSAPPQASAYAETCRERLHLERLRVRERLLRELGRLERLQQRAVQGVRLHRVMSAGLRVDTRRPRVDPPPLPPPARRRVEALLAQRPLFPAH